MSPIFSLTENEQPYINLTWNDTTKYIKRHDM